MDELGPVINLQVKSHVEMQVQYYCNSSSEMLYTLLTVMHLIIVYCLSDVHCPMKVSLMLASHCSEIDTRWLYEYGILNLARRWPRTWSTANEQRKQVRCLQKVTRWHPNHTRRQHEDVNLYSMHADYLPSLCF